ncbi:aspartate-alanine antiporter [Oxalobacter vibrioformis]|uniref:Aspartate-alanine antiporter n=1 Tax=Oxalobacter vibrioformis TaxID=933080 RepID=A0A9E9LXW6_9BURK|nr:aspartate-alanine antiporter [Oxalobacter vibrioformis]WAW09444.1 aspartate-alanine antiporter [Oxalobacter vibrioformis]
MHTIYAAIHHLFTVSPELALFLSLCLGYLVGKINFGKFQLGGVAGSLLMAVLVSQFGVHINDVVKNILFALFIFAVGYTSGPMFFRSLGRQSIREIILSGVLALTGLATVVILAHVFSLDKGTAAGIAAGGLTQSAIMGTAESAINSMNLGPEVTSQMVANISVGYGVTYIFGSFGTILICVNLLEKFMGRTIRDDAMKAEAAQHSTGIILGEGEQLAAPEFIGRVFLAGTAAGKTVSEFEQSFGAYPITIERIRRNNASLGVSPQTVLEANDKILVIGQRSALLATREMLGSEQAADRDMQLPILTREIVLTSTKYNDKTLREIRDMTSPDMRHGIYILSISRGGNIIPVALDTQVENGDIFRFYGAEQDIRRVAAELGYAIIPSEKTDMVFMSLGVVVGLLIGLVVLHIDSIPITLGSGGGALLSGLIFGWWRSRHMNMGSLPGAASQLLKDLGLAGFVAVVGLNYGMQAVDTVKAHGVSIFLIGVLVTIIPLIITMVFGRYVLKYDNVAIFAGALSGSRSANPAFGEILDKAENSVPTTPFAITYALANVFLTLLGPLVVAFT